MRETHEEVYGVVLAPVVSYAEIGETLGIAEGTVAATLSQAHRQLGAALSTNNAPANEVMA